ncbi:LOW QUALITY PROTEIN: coiled-coil domain-containing protein 153 [Egretta garzetta]|uniref:LOW QUALITY PROTEIN: coiled-coil domain-containing protein 153 n=1 Tax=Egretta garzetta TaxID=188379 RepID=UPI00051F1295|nr:LOW QUALITY PROTEIN: coiled-coil domain-containing protein 153 [Egretta garzetta]
MPLKSKGKGRKGVRQQQKRNIAESQAEEKYRKAAQEADMPKEHLVPWRDITWQAKADNEVLKQRLWDLEKALEQAQEDKRDIHEEMTQQYQELQKQRAAHSQCLEVKVKSLQEQLTTRLRESQQTQETAPQALAERDRTIAQLQGSLNAMEREYKKILHGSLDLVLAKMAEASQHWEEVGMTITMENKEHLQEFGLNPLEIQCPGDPREQDRLSAPTCLSAHLESFPHPLPHTPAAPG